MNGNSIALQMTGAKISEAASALQRLAHVARTEAKPAIDRFSRVYATAQRVNLRYQAKN